jgi:hypothetical protein
MKEVEVTATIEVARSRIAERLSPETIVEYNDPWTIKSTRETAEGKILTVTTEQFEDVELQFTEQPNGYKYIQVSSNGPFEYMETDIELSGDRPTEIFIRSKFTFGGRFVLLKNWLGTTLRKEELEGMVMNMSSDVTEDQDEREAES